MGIRTTRIPQRRRAKARLTGGEPGGRTEAACGLDGVRREARSETGSLVAVEHIEVCADRVSFDVRVTDPQRHRTTAEIAARVLQVRPDLARHACVNPKGRFFGDVIDDTPLPHLLEHLVIDFLVEASSDSRVTYLGQSRWTDERAGRARIDVSMTDDLAVLRAFRAALALLDEAEAHG